MFLPTAPLGNTVATTIAVASLDDNLGQDAGDGGDASQWGAWTNWFTLTAGSMPTDANTETGFDKTSDNGIDADSNLSIDMGFKPLSLTVGEFGVR